VGVLTVQIVFACFPVAVLTDGGALLRHVEEDVRGSSEILLAMSIVTFTPFVLLIN
jgi:hypothetical protein